MPDFRIRYTGARSGEDDLRRLLRDEGVDVKARDPWASFTSTDSGMAQATEAVVVSIIATGAYDAIKVAIGRFRERSPQSSVEIEDDETQDERSTQ